MEDREDKETVMEPLRQIGIAIALVVVLYGIMLILDSLFNILGAYIGHYLWLFYQIVVAILIIFVGAKLYVIAKTIKVVDLKRMARSFQKEKASLQALIVPPAFLITLFLLAGLLPLHSGNIISEWYKPIFQLFHQTKRTS